MEQLLDQPVPHDGELHRFLDRALFRFELATLVVLLLLTLVQPTFGRAGVPTWVLLLLAIGYRLLVEFVRNHVRVLHTFTWKAALDVPVAVLIYSVGAEPGGPLFVLFFLAVTCATASLTLRGSLIYTAIVMASVAVIDPTLPQWSLTMGNLRNLVTRLILLALLGVGTTILRRRLVLEQVAAQSKRAEAARLEQRDHLRGQFVSHISHDLRTPLTAARAGLVLLNTSLADRIRPDEHDLLSTARRNIDRLQLQITDLLTYNQLAAGAVQLEREPLDLRAVVMEAMNVVHPLLREKAQMLELHLAQPLLLDGDARRLELVVVNLLANAHFHTPSGTRIAIAGVVRDSEVHVTVSDTGPGIPPPALNTIFEPFHHVAAAEGGSGLGLMIARSIIEMHHGQIRVESTPGHGAAFHIVLPSAPRAWGGETL
jgi:signal transduction histidine kinase